MMRTMHEVRGEKQNIVSAAGAASKATRVIPLTSLQAKWGPVDLHLISLSSS